MTVARTITLNRIMFFVCNVQSPCLYPDKIAHGAHTDTDMICLFRCSRSFSRCSGWGEFRLDTPTIPLMTWL